MLILISARGQYVTWNESLIVGVYDNLRDAVASCRMAGLKPIYAWDNE